MMYTSAKAALGTYTNLAVECKVLPKDSEYIEKLPCLSQLGITINIFCMGVS